ncbi:MAG: hypothetical protein GQ525_15725 [Draconibacterium sp.]|nr:hypothetical protein [Draconibacterium sp.]
MRKIVLLIILFQCYFIGFSQETNDEDLWKIDSIEIEKNWRTRDKIIIRELQFKSGETIDKTCLDNSINQIWNIGNFAQVDYYIDTISDGSYLLKINAKDAFTLLPILSFNGNREDYNLALGVHDNNFLGRNISLSLAGNVGTSRKDYNVSISIPRQLLYKNMTLSFQALNGSGNNYRYEGAEKISVVAYRKTQFSGGIGNPFHTDYKYTFSPNLSWNFFQHKTDTSLIDSEVPFANNYEIKYLALSLGESFGLINRKRHQRDGYTVSGGYGIGIGLDKNSPVYHSFGMGASYYKTANKIVQFSASFSTGYTTSTTPSLIHYLGSGHVKGLISGEESGQGYYNGKIEFSFTYFDRNWFALEHSVYTNFGKANDHYFDMYKQAPRVSIGTGFKIWTPMIPWLGASIHFSYLKGSSNWFYLNI